MLKFYINNLKKLLLTLIYPKNCANCGIEGAIMCKKCLLLLTMRTPQCFVCNRRTYDARICPACKHLAPYTRAYSPLSYREKAVGEMIHRLKYRHIKEYGTLLGKILGSSALKYQLTPKNSIILPIPLHAKRERSRGFNQAEIIAKACAEIIKIPLPKNKVLIKTLNTAPQTKTLNKTERIKNMTGAFIVKDATEIFGKIVILIDDVITTGATINEAIKAVKRGGAKAVWVFTAAR